MNKPRIRITKRVMYFYNVLNAYVGDYNLGFFGSYNVDELYNQIGNDNIEIR